MIDLPSKPRSDEIKNLVAAIGAGLCLVVVVDQFTADHLAPALTGLASLARIVVIALSGSALVTLFVCRRVIQQAPSRLVMVYLTSGLVSTITILFARDLSLADGGALLGGVITGLITAELVWRVSSRPDSVIVVAWLPVLALHLASIASVLYETVRTPAPGTVIGALFPVLSLYITHQKLLEERAYQ